MPTTKLLAGLRAMSLTLGLISGGSPSAHADVHLHYKGKPFDLKLCHANSTKKCLAGNVYADLYYTGSIPSNYTGYIGDRNGIYFKHGFIGATDAYKVVVVTSSIHFKNGRPDNWLVNTSNEAPNCENVHRHFETTDFDDIVDAYQRACPPSFRIYGTVRSPGSWVIEPDQDE